MYSVMVLFNYFNCFVGLTVIVAPPRILFDQLQNGGTIHLRLHGASRNRKHRR